MRIKRFFNWFYEQLKARWYLRVGLVTSLCGTYLLVLFMLGLAKLAKLHFIPVFLDGVSFFAILPAALVTFLGWSLDLALNWLIRKFSQSAQKERPKTGWHISPIELLLYGLVGVAAYMLLLGVQYPNTLRISLF